MIAVIATKRLGALAALTCCSSLLVNPSRGFATAHLARLPQQQQLDVHRYSTVGGGRGPRTGLVSTVTKLRGGSPAGPNVAMVAAGEVSAAALDALRSASAHVPLGGPALFAQVRHVKFT